MNKRLASKQKPETILGRVDHRFGSEVLIRLATGAYVLELSGFCSQTSEFVLGVNPEATAKRRVALNQEQASDWGKAHCVWAAH